MTVLLKGELENWRKGNNINEKHLDYRCYTTVDVELSGNFFGWVVASGGLMKIVGPKEVVDKFEDTLKPYFSEKEQ